jgi:hypothetical protein
MMTETIPSDVSAAVAALTSMSQARLQREWQRVYKSAAPAAYTSDLLIRGIAHRLQEQAMGVLPLATRRELDRLAGLEGEKAKARAKGAQANRQALRPGVRLVRRWQGKSYAVLVAEKGFLFEDRAYGSLSMIAREITGTRWSGPRFFGIGA